MDVFTTFVNSGLHGVFPWPKKAYAVIPSKVFGKRFWAVTSEYHDHAEVEVIKKALAFLQQQPTASAATPKKITIFMSYSPCNSCRFLLIDFFEQCKERFGQDTTMEIVIAALWNIPRPSCETRGCYGKHMEPNDATDGNTQSIRMLMAWRGINVRPIGTQDWTDLGVELGIGQDNINSQAARREVEDAYLAQDFQNLFGWTMNLEVTDKPNQDTLAASDEQDEYSENMYEIETLDNWRTSDKNWRPITGEDETDGWTSLHLACYYDRDYDVDKYVEKYVGLNDLSIATTSGSSQGLREQGSQDSVGENVDTAPSQPETPPKFKMIKYEYPPSNINTQTEDGETPLFVACERGNARVVKKLLRYQDLIDVNLANHQGKTPLDVAEEMEHIEVVRQLNEFKK